MILTSYILILAYFSYYQSIRLRTRSQIVQNAFSLSVPWHSRFHLPTSGDPHAAAFETARALFLACVMSVMQGWHRRNQIGVQKRRNSATSHGRDHHVSHFWMAIACGPIPILRHHMTNHMKPYCWYVDIALYPNVVPMYLNVPSCFNIYHPCWGNSQSEAFYWPRAEIFGKPRDPSNPSLAGSLL